MNRRFPKQASSCFFKFKPSCLKLKETLINSLRCVRRPLSRPTALIDGAITASSGIVCRLAEQKMGASSAVRAINHYFLNEALKPKTGLVGGGVLGDLIGGKFAGINAYRGDFAFIEKDWVWHNTGITIPTPAAT